MDEEYRDKRTGFKHRNTTMTTPTPPRSNEAIANLPPEQAAYKIVDGCNDAYSPHLTGHQNGYITGAICTLLMAKEAALTEATAARDAQMDVHHAIDSKPPEEGKETVIFINDHDFGAGNLAHNYRAARQWFKAFVHSLEDGDEITVTFRRKDMTRSEIEALPEL